MFSMLREYIIINFTDLQRLDFQGFSKIAQKVIVNILTISAFYRKIFKETFLSPLTLRDNFIEVSKFAVALLKSSIYKIQHFY